MTWSYRVIKQTQHGETTYCIHEVYYDEDGKLTTWTATPTFALGETLDELRADLLMMLDDIGKRPVLDMDELLKNDLAASLSSDKGEGE